MRKIAIFIATLFSFAACDLNKLEPAQTKAFMKYYGDEGFTTGVDLLKLDDGYLLLGNNSTSAVGDDNPIAVLIKVDLNGNQLWASNFPGILGSSLAKSTGGYFIVGEGIDITNPLNTSMSLIKTDFDGDQLGVTVYLGAPLTNYHGTAVTISSTDEVVVCGYLNAGTNNQTFLYGYDQDLTPTWTLRKYAGGTDDVKTSNKLIENSNGEFVHTKVVMASSGPELNAMAPPRDSETVNDGQQLLQNYSISSSVGGFNGTSTGSILVQTVNTSNGIVLATYGSGLQQSSVLIEESTDDVLNSLFANAVIESGNDAVILGSTNKHADKSTRTDLDFYIAKVGSTNGVEGSTSGFKTYIGGTGNETGAAIVKADDGGFVFLGTMANTNDVKLMVLGKVNSKGELIN